MIIKKYLTKIKKIDNSILYETISKLPNITTIEPIEFTPTGTYNVPGGIWPGLSYKIIDTN